MAKKYISMTKINNFQNKGKFKISIFGFEYAYFIDKCIYTIVKIGFLNYLPPLSKYLPLTKK